MISKHSNLLLCALLAALLVYEADGFGRPRTLRRNLIPAEFDDEYPEDLGLDYDDVNTNRGLRRHDGSEEECPPGETMRCRNMEDRCDGPNPFSADEQCIEQCSCMPGYARETNGRCVRKTRCGGVVARYGGRASLSDNRYRCPGPNEHWGCANCQKTCKRRRPLCGRMCIPGCDCDPGYVRDDRGICIPIEACSRGGQRSARGGQRSARGVPEEELCPDPNSFFRPCSSPPPYCDFTCENVLYGRWDEARSCSTSCTGSGYCQCKFGYFKHPDGRCVIPRTCKRLRLAK